MNVYVIVQRCDNEFYGVFSTKEEADAYAGDCKDYSVVEAEVDALKYQVQVKVYHASLPIGGSTVYRQFQMTDIDSRNLPFEGSNRAISYGENIYAFRGYSSISPERAEELMNQEYPKWRAENNQ